jgi:competence protein ComEC
MRRPRSYARILSLACLGILAADPLAAVTPGFQLSFFAVALLIWSGQQFKAPVMPCRSMAGGRILDSALHLTVLQVFLLFGLMPLTALLFDRITWLAPFVNLLALPIFNLCTTPLSLLAILLDGPLQFAGDALLRLAHFSVVILLWLVDLAGKSPYAEFRTLPLTGVMLAALWATGLWAALPPGLALLAGLRCWRRSCTRATPPRIVWSARTMWAGLTVGPKRTRGRHARHRPAFRSGRIRESWSSVSAFLVGTGSMR